MKIGDFDLNKNVFIIAEIGNNHEGDLELAKRMICLAAEAGADAVKFQTIVPEKLVSFQSKDRIAQLKKFRFSYKQFEQLSELAREQNLVFLSTPFDLDSVKALNDFVPAFKIASSDIAFYPLIESVAKTGKPLMFSTGIADIAQIGKVKGFVKSIWDAHGIEQSMAFMHCVSKYPTENKDAELLMIDKIKDLDVVVGYSDHTIGVSATVLSVAIGARIIEKHFTIDNDYSDFRDHKLSADPKEFRSMVQQIRDAEVLIGRGFKNIDTLVAKNMQRSIVATKDLSAGSKVTIFDIDWVRPAGGFCPGEENSVIGKTMVNPILKGSMFKPEDLK